MKNLPLSEGQAIGIHCCPFACSTGDIIETSFAEMVTSLLFEFVGIGGHGRQLISEDAIFINLLPPVSVSTLAETCNHSITFWKAPYLRLPSGWSGCGWTGCIVVRQRRK